MKGDAAFGGSTSLCTGSLGQIQKWTEKKKGPSGKAGRGVARCGRTLHCTAPVQGIIRTTDPARCSEGQGQPGKGRRRPPCIDFAPKAA